MSDTGHFFLTGSAGTNSYLAWDGTSLEIAGFINITSGPTLTTINNTTSSLNNVSSSLNNVSSSLNAVSGTTALNFQSSSLLDQKIFTDASGRIVRTPTTATEGLYLGSTAMGYYSGSSFKTYMANNGNFFLTGSGGNYLSWNGGVLTIAGAINILGGNAATVSYVDSGDSTTYTNSTGYADAQDLLVSASAATGITSLSSSAHTARTNLSGALSASTELVNQKVFTDSTGRVVRTPSTTTAGLYLGSTAMGYYSGSSFKTFMANNGNFFLTGSGGNFLSWESGVLTINGSITITGGNAATTAYVNTVSGSVMGYADAGDAATYSSAQGFVNTQITALSSSAHTARGVIDAKVKTDSQGRVVGGTTSPSVAGLHLSPTYLGFHNGNGSTTGWGVFIKSDGQFFFNGNGTNYISWNLSKMTIAAEQFDLTSTGTSKIRLGGATNFGDAGIYMDNNGLFSAMLSSRGIKVNSSYSTVKIEGNLSLWNASSGAGNIYASQIFLAPAIENFSTGEQSSPAAYINSSGDLTAHAIVSTTTIQSTNQMYVGGGSAENVVAKAKISTSTPSGTPTGGHGTLWLQVS
jgi:hypothetical protein